MHGSDDLSGMPRPISTDSAADLWMEQMGRLSVLSKSEHLRLAQTIQAGRSITDRGESFTPAAQRAVQRLVAHNLRLVVHVWNRNYRYRVPATSPALPDLLQEGACGLQRGAQKFDPTRGYSFATYAPWWIRKGFTDFFRNQSRTVRMPGHATIAAESAHRQLAEYEQLGVPVTSEMFENLASDLKTRPGLLQQYMISRHITQCVSGDRDNTSAREGQTGRTLLDCNVSEKPKDEEDPQLLHDFELVAARAHLDPHEREILLAIGQGFQYRDLDALFPEYAPCTKIAMSARNRFRIAAQRSRSELRSMCAA